MLLLLGSLVTSHGSSSFVRKWGLQPLLVVYYLPHQQQHRRHHHHHHHHHHRLTADYYQTNHNCTHSHKLKLNHIRNHMCNRIPNPILFQLIPMKGSIGHKNTPIPSQIRPRPTKHPRKIRPRVQSKHPSQI